MRYVLALVAALTTSVVLLTSGCSGAGAKAGAIRGDDIRAVAVDHLSALLQVKTWQAVLYAKPAQPVLFDMEFLPDGTIHLWGALEDGNTFEQWVAPDQSAYGSETRKSDGAVASFTWSPLEDSGGIMRQHLTETLFAGQTIDMDSQANPETAWQQWDGTFTTPAGDSLHFSLDRVDLGRDVLNLVLSDGSRLALQVPLTSTEGAGFWPVFASGADGTFTDPAGVRQTFHLTGAGERWGRWTLTSGDFQGEFELGADFRGSGQLTRSGAVTAVLTWPATGSGTLSFTSAGTADILPSAASRDFQVDQWLAAGARLVGLPF